MQATIILTILIHSDDNIAGHCASGICWGLNIFFIFILIVMYENKGKKIFRDIFLLLSMVLFIFSVIVIPIVEVVYLKYKFFQNFGQILHLVSMIVVVPFIFIWRNQIEINVKLLLNGSMIEKERRKVSISMIVILLLQLINLYGVLKMVVFTF
jgi:hypothetical protein